MAKKKSKTSSAKRSRKKPATKRQKKSRKDTAPLKQIRWGVLVTTLAVVASATWLLYRDTKPDFNAERAFEDIVRQVEFGPRVPGSEEHRRARLYLVKTLQQYADRVGEQQFTYTDRHAPLTRGRSGHRLDPGGLHPTWRSLRSHLRCSGEPPVLRLQARAQT